MARRIKPKADIPNSMSADDYRKWRKKNGVKEKRNTMAHVKAGWRKIGGVKKYYRSKTEANYARYLEYLKQRGEVLEWEHEPRTFWFNKNKHGNGVKRGVRSYTPDFRVVLRGGKEEWHEVKGYMDKRSATKIKRFRKYFPELLLVVIMQTQVTQMGNTIGRAIKGWE